MRPPCGRRRRGGAVARRVPQVPGEACDHAVVVGVHGCFTHSTRPRPLGVLLGLNLSGFPRGRPACRQVTPRFPKGEEAETTPLTCLSVCLPVSSLFSLLLAHRLFIKGPVSHFAPKFSVTYVRLDRSQKRSDCSAKGGVTRPASTLPLLLCLGSCVEGTSDGFGEQTRTY